MPHNAEGSPAPREEDPELIADPAEEAGALKQLLTWIDAVSGSDWLWDVKFISANDTNAKPNVHQAGPYVSKALLRAAFPELSARAETENNPDRRLPAAIASDPWQDDVRLIWYNSRVFKKQANGRNEARLTGWGGKESPLLEADATGKLVVFAYHLLRDRDADSCSIWLCRNEHETDFILDRIGDVEPGAGITVSPTGLLPLREPEVGPCSMKPEQLPAAWVKEFPSGEEISKWVARERPMPRLTPDQRLMKRRKCEEEVFRSIEDVHVLPRLRRGFETVEEFTEFANGVLNRRKSRSGRSLELLVKNILEEEGIGYSWGEATEGKRTPDFVFPSIDRYKDAAWSDSRLRMLAAKTTCKDRWRQVRSEAKRIQRKHLITLQEGVSTDQFREMQEDGVILVVPESLVEKYPEDVQPHLVTLSVFLQELRTL
jgi:hypothetical protein